MSVSPQQFSYVSRNPTLGSASLAPMLPLALTAGQTVSALGLVDSGSAISVLPHSIGLQLGLDWSRQTKSVRLSGNLAVVEARAVAVSVEVGSFPPVHLVFAWADTDAVSLILGQTNLFMEF